ncbi:ATP-binding protein [Lysobacter sp. MMG2]|uniref:ATP-binding protein n=1 Tax=Lysobacter sp. MMG2 TaxID=2801338 RepID=UPI0031F32A6D
MNWQGLPIFARTFLLLLAALAVAYGIGIALLALREPPPAVRMSEVVALLSSRMPSGNPLLQVREVDAPPQVESGYLSPPPLRTLLAQWLDVPEDRVRFYIAGPNMLPPFRRIVVTPTVPLTGGDMLDLVIPRATAQTLDRPAPPGAHPLPRDTRRATPDAPLHIRYRDRPDFTADRIRARREERRRVATATTAVATVSTSSSAAESPPPTASAPIASESLEPYPTRTPDPSTAYLRQYMPPYVHVSPAHPEAPAPSPATTATAPAPVAATPAPVRDDPEALVVRVGEPEMLTGPALRERPWRADSHLSFAFVAAARLADGRWRVVERVESGVGIGRAFALMFAMGLIALLPLAWWFSRALAGPIRRFAAAADHMGQDADGPPVPLEGPAEIVRAAASFNAMQARINRLVRERTQMVAAIAHDLRTPLARLSFRLDGLPADAREKATADIAEMSQMIEAALEFIREQHRNGTRERLDLRLLVESVVDDLADVGNAVALTDGAPAPLRGDPLALRRMVGNLVDNALKYGQSARLSLHTDAEGYALHIDDDGPGVDANRSEQLFMPFVRGETSRNRETGGIGLGLATARSIALAHGGDIHLINRSEGGLRVTVTLPCAVRSPRSASRVAVG